jgi:pimeloyl-ACP methyl ester carboxylesterase
MLACELGRDHRVVVLERPGAAHGAIPATYYADTDYLAAWLADCRAVLAAEQIDSCHVASWCSGAKFALELAHACPGTVRSLSLLAPSFAGMEGFAGRDSAYEQSLHTMCKVVDKMPKTAATMAATMLQMMEKNSRDLERFDPLRKDAVDILELADAHHQPALYQPFAGAAQLVDFSRQLMQFRSHDVRHLLTDAKLRVPVLLVTGSCDTTTSNERAKDLCRRLAGVAGFEIDGASHYLIHQEYALVAALLRGFLRDGLEMQCDRFHIQRSLFRQVPATAPATAPRAAQHVPG